MYRLVQQRPNPALAQFIETLWYYELDGADSQVDRVLPHGAFELVISLSNPAGGDLISGPRTKPMIVDPGGFSPIVGAHFRPGGAAIFGYPASEFRDIDVQLEDVWSRQARQLRDQLLDQSEPEECLRLLEETLTRSAPGVRDQHPAVSLAVAEFHLEYPAKRIRDLVAESGLSQRRFIEVFSERIGLTPKLYARIQRFQRTLQRAAGQNSIDWAAIAFESGYSDQAHLIRDFREFSGLTPTEYAPRWPDQPNHVPLAPD